MAIAAGASGSAVSAPSVATAGQAGAQARKTSFYIPTLDGMRAGAVLLVFLSHAWTKRWLPGNFGVTVFFFLSGYLITTLLRMEFEQRGTISFKDFYLRRVLRIFPPFYVVLIVASALTMGGLLEGSVQFHAALFQVFFLSNYYIIHAGWWTGRAPGTWVFWSLAVEEHFYLVFPLFYLLLRRFQPSARRQALIMLAICGVVLLWRCALVFGLHASQDRTYMATDTRIDSILFGCILAVWGNPVLDKTSISDRALKWVWLPLGTLGLLVSFAVFSPRFEESFRYTLQGLSLFPFFIAGIRLPTWAFFRILNIGWVRFMGVLSYAFYLLHPTVIFGVQQWTHWNQTVQAALALALAVLLSWAIHVYVERPATRLRKRLARVG
jgi:peptidoglycan/LPS O-acetylase OafA/YrhL